MEKSKVYVGLIHYPVYDKNKRIVNTAIKNLDIHDISRVCQTYGVEKYFIVNPLEKMKIVANRIISFWEDGIGSVYNENRKESISKISVVDSIDDVLQNIKSNSSKKINIVYTTAKKMDNQIDYQKMRAIINSKFENYLILFGTGWGLTEDLLLNADYVLEPVQADRYNHLSVRSAASIIIDRLLSS